jgi:hypothetical protein
MSLTRSYRDLMTSLDRIAITIDCEGFEALDRHTIDDVLELAAAADASPVLAEVLGDDCEPAPVRERAFGLLAMQIARSVPQSAIGSKRAVRRLGRNGTGFVQSTPCSSSRTRSRRSRVPVPASGADSRSNWPVEAPILR